ncbi:hypothetical protein Btru_009295, partial [Bulinus truncatus]
MKLLIVYHFSLCFQLHLAHFACKPAEEGFPFLLVMRWSHSGASKDIVIKRAETVIGSCDLFNECYSSFLRFDIFVTSHGENQYSTSVQIKNTTRIDADLWTIAYIGKFITSTSILASCHLKTYTRPVNIALQVSSGEEGIHVCCIAEKVFPEAKCTFSVFISGVNAYFNNKNIFYNHTTLTDQDQFYNSTCYVMLPKSEIIPGDYEINATLYPKEVEKYGTTNTVEFDIVTPVVKLKECSDLVEEIKTITCECNALDNTSIIRIQWFDKYGNHLRNGEILNITTQRLDSEYECYGINIFGLKSPSVWYRPRIS